MSVAPRIAIVGAGIVGTALAWELAREGATVTVLDSFRGEPSGSTAFAPGFIGVYNDAPALTALAGTSVDRYRSFANAFSVRGGWELATSNAGAAHLEDRVAAAREAGLDARLHALPDDRALPSFVDPRGVITGAHYAGDASADPAILRREIQRAATAQGAVFRHGQTAQRMTRESGLWRIQTERADTTVDADHLVLATGVWSPEANDRVGIDLPIYPVAHPYVYAAPNAPRVEPGPFVRWPEHHVYARAHGDTLGIGTYDHPPVRVARGDLAAGAGLEWRADFDSAVTRAQQRLRPEARFVPSRRVNGVFAMTPDNLPFLGPHARQPHLWVAQAIWVTHAGGAAAELSAAILRGASLRSEFAVDRFEERPERELRDAALRLYRDIYANDASSTPVVGSATSSSEGEATAPDGS